MNRILLVLLFMWSVQYAFAQKPVIDSTSYNRWPSVGEGRLSNDGKYVVYNVKSTLWSNTIIKQVVKSMDNSWQLEIPEQNKKNPEFCSNSRYCIFGNSKDSLGIIVLGSSVVKYIANVSTWEIPSQGSGQWLCYQLNKDEKTLFFRNLKTGKERTFHNVLNHQWSEDGEMLVLQTKSVEKDKNESLSWVDMNTGIITRIWKNVEPQSLLLDFRHKQIAIKTGQSIWLYKIGISAPVLIIDETSQAIETTLKLGDLNSFSKNGDRLFITLKSKNSPKPITESTGVEVWSYIDKKIQSIQDFELAELALPSYIAVINLIDKKLVQIQKYTDENFLLPEPEYNNVLINLALLAHKEGNGDLREGSWNRTVKDGYDLVSTSTGKRKGLGWLDKKENISLSPGGRFITYFDKEQAGYFSYEVSSGVIRSLTEGLKISWFDVIQPEYKMIRGVAGWLENDERILVYDSYDIWKLDPSGRIPPVNLTNGYGAKHRIVFNLGLERYTNQPISLIDNLILNAFDLENKNNGFFSKPISEKGNPVLLTMGPYAYHLLLSNHHLPLQQTGDYPAKAKNADIYLIKRTSSNKSSNYFSTTDFKTFKPISDVHPEKSYNWYNTELHSWKSLDGRELQGILYKPENFDPNKKYPVVFYYYEKITGELNVCLTPEFSSGSIDIPTYVSNGYLVFCPDIYYTVGDPMQGTYDAVVSAAQYLVTLPFVNPIKMGIQGHSWGGAQTNYLITRTKLFAAACSASGVADWISIYGSLFFNDDGAWIGSFYENGQPRMGTSIWEKKNVYIKNSAVLHADQITTPLLIMHTKKDRVCLYSNIMEFFLGLRRLGKKAWMLAYAEGIHSVHGKESEDFTIRMQQFFDHYLKDKPAPIWMLNGIAAKERGVKSVLELDTTGRRPGPGLLTMQEQKKVDSLMTVKPMTITLK